MRWQPFRVWLPIPERRWPRFRLSTYLLAVGLLVICFAWMQDRRALQRELDALRPPNARWDTHQATGPPNTFGYGDYRTAWASKSADGAREWLLLEYPAKVMPVAIVVHETYNPGAVVEATGFNERGEEETLWTGTDPTPPTAKGGISRLVLMKQMPTKQIKLYLDSPSVKGWNEIDAVGLQTADGSVVWAIKAAASSSYGKNAKTLQEATAHALATRAQRFNGAIFTF